MPWVLSAAISAGIFWYLISQIDPAELIRAVRRMAAGPLMAYGALTVVGVLARASRFWILLARRVPFRVMLAVTLARNLFIDLIPARLGELSYVYLLSRRAGRPAEEGLASLALSILFDMAALAPLLVLALVIVGGGDGFSVGWLMAASGALAVAAVVTMRLAEPLVRLAARILRRRTASARLARVAGKLDETAEHLRDTRRRGVFLQVFGISAIIRLCKFGSYYALFLAVMTPYGYSVGTSGFFRVFLGVVGAEIAAALPIHGIAGFGTFEGAWAFTFTRLGFSREHAIISGIVAHAISQLVEYTLGAAALLWLMRPGIPRSESTTATA